MESTETQAAPTTILSALKLLFNEQVFGAYYGGTLEVAGMAAHSEGWEMIEGMFKSGREITPYTPEEKYWWAQLYVKHKSETHAYYLESVDYITKYEGEL